jgi:hypothetical protein
VTNANRKRPRCTRSVVDATFERGDLPAGVNSVAFSARIGGRTLRAAAYRLYATPTDQARNAGKAQSAAFKIVRR